MYISTAVHFRKVQSNIENMVSYLVPEKKMKKNDQIMISLENLIKLSDNHNKLDYTWLPFTASFFNLAIADMAISAERFM